MDYLELVHDRWNEYLLEGEAVSNEFLALVKEKFKSGQCYLLLHDFYGVEADLKGELDIFVDNYKKCRIYEPPKNPISSRNRIFKLSFLFFLIIMVVVMPVPIGTDKVDDNNPWYNKAKMESDNQIALEYLNLGLDEYPKHVDSLVLKIKLLLLIGGRDKRAKAEKVADVLKKMGVSREWVDCLKRENFFKSSDRLVMTTETEIESLCP
ncbi:hypothetical protein PN36_25475 [Candidatus Thiomargarita nelsonii]|uniref:Uncharacterized protein n=1 Tax=Candidatus Thiomargarita nelsonii TaxID=1003181 RepID=A0A0A6P452_9GAMM|nr:hypothetical protein PN36_25475 [Candidatus Thiomargarita nelsonii]